MTLVICPVMKYFERQIKCFNNSLKERTINYATHLTASWLSIIVWSEWNIKDWCYYLAEFKKSIYHYIIIIIVIITIIIIIIIITNSMFGLIGCFYAEFTGIVILYLPFIIFSSLGTYFHKIYIIIHSQSIYMLFSVELFF